MFRNGATHRRNGNGAVQGHESTTVSNGESKKVDLVQLPDNFMFFKWMSVKGAKVSP